MPPLTETVERRVLIQAPEVRMRLHRGEGAAPMIQGHVALFDVWTEIGGRFRERIAAGAFDKALERSDPRALFNHDPNWVLGRKSSGTATWRIDQKGLWLECTPPDSQTHRDVILTPMERGDITGASFSFTVKKEGQVWDRKEDVYERTILEVDELFDGGPVTFPAYAQTEMNARDASGALRELQAFEQEMAEAARAAEPPPQATAPHRSYFQIRRMLLPERLTGCR